MTRSKIRAQAQEMDTCFLFSPSSSYPQPFACLIDREAEIVHAWSTALDQPDFASDPPTYLRGWNHVELARDGSLYVTVPLHSLLKLRPDSSLLWRVQLPVHHDLDIGPDGDVYVLTEEPRLVPWRGGVHVLLDNTVTIISGDGAVLAAHSLYDVLTTDPILRSLVDEEIGRRRADLQQRDRAVDALAGYRAIAAETAGPGFHRGGRDASRLLRELPGSPSDILHANTVEVLAAHPGGLWSQGDVLVSLRNLDVIAVLDLRARSVRWLWGLGELSGQHQPSGLPGGNVLVFDNGQAAGRSRVVEINPGSGAIVWQYTTDPPQDLFCAMAGGCERLANGNILISDAQAGRAFEVTRDGQTVWAVQTRTTRSPEAAASRAEIYRMSAVPAATASVLGGGDEAARPVVHAKLRCELSTTLLPSGRSGS